MTLPASRGAGGTPGFSGAVVGCGVGDGFGVGVGVDVGVSVGVDVEQDVGVGEGIVVGIAPGWAGTRLVPQAATVINRAPKNSGATYRRNFAYIVSSSFTCTL